MPIYLNMINGKYIEWWACPFCNKRLIAMYPDDVDVEYLRLCHLSQHKNVSKKEVHDRVYGKDGLYEKGELTDEILTEAVLDKL